MLTATLTTGDVVSGVFAAAIIFVAYFAPSLVAVARHHHNLVALVVANLLTGWTVIGWVICLIWAFMRVRVVAIRENPDARGVGTPGTWREV